VGVEDDNGPSTRRAAVDSMTGVDRLRAVIEAGVAITGGLELDMILP
jgi:hypothetical protein